MPSFTDFAGRTWDVAFTAGAIRVARKALGIDLRLAARGYRRTIDAVLEPPVRVAQLAAVVCHRQREERLITPEEFGRMMTDVGTYTRAADALLEALADFYPTSPFGRRFRYGLAVGRGQVPHPTTN